MQFQGAYPGVIVVHQAESRPERPFPAIPAPRPHGRAGVGPDRHQAPGEAQPGVQVDFQPGLKAFLPAQTGLDVRTPGFG